MKIKNVFRYFKPRTKYMRSLKYGLTGTIKDQIKKGVEYLKRGHVSQKVISKYQKVASSVLRGERRKLISPAHLRNIYRNRGGSAVIQRLQDTIDYEKGLVTSKQREDLGNYINRTVYLSKSEKEQYLIDLANMKTNKEFNILLRKVAPQSEGAKEKKK